MKRKPVYLPAGLVRWITHSQGCAACRMWLKLPDEKGPRCEDGHRIWRDAIGWMKANPREAALALMAAQQGRVRDVS